MYQDIVVDAAEDLVGMQAANQDVAARRAA
jgi:hypothetical protein